MPYLVCREERSSTNTPQVDNSQGVHISPQDAEKLLCLQHRQSNTNGAYLTDNQLTSKDRLYLIAGLIGEYQQLCHDDSQPDDLTPEQHHAELVNYTDEELIIDADLHDSPYESCEEFYLTHASYCPEQYFVD